MKLDKILIVEPVLTVLLSHRQSLIVLTSCYTSEVEMEKGFWPVTCKEGMIQELDIVVVHCST